MDNGVLTVSGERTAPESEDANYYVRERTPDRFSRSFNLPRSPTPTAPARGRSGPLRPDHPSSVTAVP